MLIVPGALAAHIPNSSKGLINMVITHSSVMDQPGKVANPARGQLNRENEYSPVPARA